MGRLQRLRHLGRANRLEQRGMRVEGQVHIRTHGVAHRLGALSCRASHGVIRHGLRARRMWRHLECRVAILGDQSFGALGKLGGSSAARALVDAHSVAALAPQQHIDRKSRGLSGDIPQRVLDPAHGCVDHRASRKAREVVHSGPQVFHVAWIFAHQPSFEIFDGGDRRLIRTDRVSLTEAVYSGVGQDLDEAQIAASSVHQKTLDVGDFQLGFAGVPRRGLRHRLCLQGQSNRSTLDEKFATFHGRYCTCSKRSPGNAF